MDTKALNSFNGRVKNKVDTNVDPVLSHAVEQLPIGDWL